MMLWISMHMGSVWNTPWLLRLHFGLSTNFVFEGENWKPSSINENNVVGTRIHGSFMGQGGEVVRSFKVKGWEKSSGQIQNKLQA